MRLEAERKFRESMGFNDKIIYHYCSIEAMFGILSNKSFWLTFLESSNDSKELKLGEKIIKEATEELKKDYPSGEHDEILNKILLGPKDKKYNKYKSRFRYYGLSFVEDNDSLTHWERYANNSLGVCIGLNVAMIENLFKVSGLPEIESDWLKTIPIIYSYEEKIKYAKSSILSKINGLSKEFKYLRDIEHIYSSIYYTTLQNLKPLFKHQGFASEKEFRIYLKEGEAESSSAFMRRSVDKVSTESKELFKNISNNIINLATELKVLQNNIKFHVFKDGIRSYYSLDLSSIWSDVLISEIVLGPKCYQNRKELKNFLKSCDLERTKISVSKVPFR